MPGHKFKVGATVDFRPGRMFEAVKNRTFRQDLLYRIKCTAEAFERVVSEAQLAERA